MFSLRRTLTLLAVLLGLAKLCACSGEDRPASGAGSGTVCQTR